MRIRTSNNILLLIIALFSSHFAISQCDENVWNDSWTSCSLSSSPNSVRAESHWLLYEFDEPQRIGKIHIWNANKTGESNLGVKDATVDYSIDGTSWTELGSYTFPKADESDDYEGFDGPSLEGLMVKKILFTFQSNYSTADSNCISIAEIVFNLGEVPESTLVHIRKRNAPDFAIEGNGDAINGQSVYLSSVDEDSLNQRWLEINRGDGYFSYQNTDSNLCLNSNASGSTMQNINLASCNDIDQDQQWQKVAVGEGTFKLIKRNDPGFAIDGGAGGADGQHIDLSDSSSLSQDLHWFIAPFDGTLEIEQELENEIITIFPNPAESEVSFQGVTGDAGFVNIYDMSGKGVLGKSVLSVTETIDISGLTTGLYIITLQTTTEIFIKKLVKL